MNTAKSEEVFKIRAKKIRQFIQDKHDLKIPHGHCLDLVSIIHGFKDWNTASAKLSVCSPKKNLGKKIDSIGRLREEIESLPDDTPLDADYTIDTLDFIRDLEMFQSGTILDFSLKLDVHGGTEKFATFKLNVEHVSAEFDNEKIEPIQHAMADFLGLKLSRS